jgi:outer membrane lipoprotein-sorting protein
LKRVVLIITLIAVSAAAYLFRPAIWHGKPLSAAGIGHLLDVQATQSYSACGETTSWYEGKQVISRIKFIHGAPNRYRVEYVSSPLKGVVVGDDGTSIWRFDPALHEVVDVITTGCSVSSSCAHLLCGNYDILQMGVGRVAGRQARILQISSHSGKLVKRLWIDEKTGVQLKCEDYDSMQHLRSRTVYDSVQYLSSVPDSLFCKSSCGHQACVESEGASMTVSGLSKALGFSVTQPHYIPKGYSLNSCRVYECMHGCCPKSAYLRYTNGLESISVFETPNHNCGMPGSCPESGANSCVLSPDVQGRTASFTRHNVAYVVIGDIDDRELHRIADSI